TQRDHGSTSSSRMAERGRWRRTGARALAAGARGVVSRRGSFLSVTLGGEAVTACAATDALASGAVGAALASGMESGASRDDPISTAGRASARRASEATAPVARLERKRTAKIPVSAVNAPTAIPITQSGNRPLMGGLGTGDGADGSNAA